jgi:Chromosome segregation ATPases
LKIYQRYKRLNLELQGLDEENIRIQDEIESIKKSLQTFDDDVNREKGIVIDANSNEKRLKEEKSDLIEIDSKYYETEKQSNEDLENAKNKLKLEIDKVKELINLKKNEEALVVLDNCILIIEEYAVSFSKNQNIKKESTKRKERINIIEKEIESWKKLLSNSEKMVTELTERKNKLNSQLDNLDSQPKLQAERKGQISEGLRISEQEKKENESIINLTDEKIETLRSQLNLIQEQSIQIRERKASSGATIEGLKKRKSDMVDRINSELNLTEENILENSNLFGKEELPDAVNQEDLLDKKKQERERLGSVN